MDGWWCRGVEGNAREVAGIYRLAMMLCSCSLARSKNLPLRAVSTSTILLRAVLRVCARLGLGE